MVDQAVLRAGIVVTLPLLDFQVRDYLRQCGGVELVLTTNRTSELLQFLRWEPLDVIICDEVLLQEVRPLVPASILLIQLRRNGRPIDAAMAVPTLDVRQPSWGSMLVAIVQQRKQPQAPADRRRGRDGTHYFGIVETAGTPSTLSMIDIESGLPTLSAFQQALAALPVAGVPTMLVFLDLQRVVAEGGYMPELLRRLRPALREHDLLFRVDQWHLALLLPWEAPDIAIGLLSRVAQALWPPHPTALVAGYAGWQPGVPVDACAQQAWAAMCAAGEPAPEHAADAQVRMA